MDNLDVIIIGAGIIGCATAFELSKAGYKTLNVDKLGDAGMGSTRNSCSLVRMTFSTVDGIQMARECFSYWKDWENYLGVEDERGFAKLINNGTVATLSEQPNFPRMLRIFKELGIEHEIWEGDEVRERLPHISHGSYFPPARMDDDRFWDDAAEGRLEKVLFVRDGGYINDPQLSTHNLKRAVEAHGGRFLFNRSVTDVRRADGRVAGVTLDGGEQIDARIVINIAGPHSRLINEMAGVEGDMKINTRPLRHEVHFVPNPNPEISEIGSHWPDVDVGVYYRPEVGNLLLIGSRDPACDPLDWVIRSF